MKKTKLGQGLLKGLKEAAVDNFKVGDIVFHSLQGLILIKDIYNEPSYDSKDLFPDRFKEIKGVALLGKDEKLLRVSSRGSVRLATEDDIINGLTYLICTEDLGMGVEVSFCDDLLAISNNSETIIISEAQVKSLRAYLQREFN